MEETEEETAALMAEKRQKFEIETKTREQDDDLGSHKNFRERIWNESKKIWEIAGPVILASGSEFSITFVTAAFVGHLGEVEFAAVSVVQNVIEGFVYGIMLGMGSALETLSGQAVGAGRFDMLGIYLQRSFIVTGATALCLMPFYIFATPFLKLLSQDKEISELAGKYSKWIVPQLFAYAINSPIQKFLQSQSRVWVMTMISMAALIFHVFLNWILVAKLNYGIVGAAIAGDISLWLMVVGLVVYVTSGCFPDAWTGFSLRAFKSLASFVKLSLASAVMLCLELWYYTAVILMVGWLNNPEIAVDAISICMNLQQWTLMISLGFHTAISVRVSNELGAGHPKAAKFSIAVSVITSAAFGILFTLLVLAFENQFPKLFTDKPILIRETSKLAYFLAATIFLNSIQAVLLGNCYYARQILSLSISVQKNVVQDLRLKSYLRKIFNIAGVAVGAGWQFLVALISIACYYVFGLPAGALLGYGFKLGINGIWSGLLLGCLFQTTVLVIRMLQTNWQKEVN
ncbi:hypothetical protein CISIN_1g010173mg [Citrus sinensis]|uniref:Protein DETOXIFICATION n=1 Tax=Citrus sinensis TaxID=2711 RepID=A0A067EC10_CITSI|nr:hypothetical protein CISIN_1g010173mg [Citrus sinensis]